MKKLREIIVDSFAGGGGASLGIAQATGHCPDVAINHDAGAIEMHKANHPETKHYTEDVWKLTPRVVTKNRPVGLLWASPDCKHFSRAKGSKPVNNSIRSLAWVIVKWAAECKPRVIILENVREFADWGPLLPRQVCGGCDWKGTEGQALLARRGGKRRCPRCESKDLRVTEEMVPDPSRIGLTFRNWVGRLKGIGYKVDWRVLDAADYGAPTHRRRLFLVARNDGQPIEWPEPTHGDPRKAGDSSLFSGPLKPWHTAAECIDWSLPCPSIFDRKKPLAEKTLKRIALGIKRYVLDNPRPFIVTYYGTGHDGKEFRGNGIDEPLRTIPTENRHGLVTPIITPLTHVGNRRSNSPAEPLPTITGANRGELAVIAPVLSRISQNGSNGKCVNGVDEPLGTVTTKAERLLVTPTLVRNFGKSVGGPVELPLPTVTAGGQGKTALFSAFIAKHFGGVVGVEVDTPLPTTTTRGTQNQLAVVNLIHLNHGDKQWSNCEEPMRTVTTGKHAALVYSFLVKYFGTSIGQPVNEPAGTMTTKDRFGLVTVMVDGEPYVIVDIGMRMLKPRELARGQGFPDDYILTGTATSQVKRIGNSVCPVMAKVMVEANYSPKESTCSTSA